MATAKQSARPRHICVERVVPWDLESHASAIAIAENPENAPPRNPHDRGERLAVANTKHWRTGRTLRVRFLDGTPFLREKVCEYACEWTDHANLHFDFSTDPNAEIRVSFEADPGSSWSALGTDALVESYFANDQPTMNFGWFTDATEESELARVIIHEFGHAIGCIHEHQNPLGGIEWNEEAVLAYYAGSPNYWDESTTRFNILDKYRHSQLNGSEFDPESIMLYGFPPELTKNHVGTRDNTRLSAADIALIKRVYPRS